jgi:adenylosuccinate synthase
MSPAPRKNARVVIGANFGDEGKGLFTDFLTERKNFEKHLVIRYNGGAQAGHTVVTPEGQRHVFGHFSSGTFNGATTFLSEFFIVNPLLFRKEWERLARHGITPKVLVDPRANVTTHYDMIVNAALEEARGAKRHGSCGVGINETVRRCTNRAYKTTVEDLLNKRRLADTLDAIRHDWVPSRFMEMRYPDAGHTHEHELNSVENLDQWYDAVDFFLSHVGFQHPETFIDDWTFTFEGAQGLLLDQSSQFYPNVTPSNTGIHNVLKICDEMNVELLDVYYMTRCYLTRHGAGLLPFESPSKPYKGIEDTTNVKHAFQGELRFAPLNLDLLCTAIQGQRYIPSDRFQMATSIVVTCLDQVKDESSISWIAANDKRFGTIYDLLGMIEYRTGQRIRYTSSGPTRKDISPRKI